MPEKKNASLSRRLLRRTLTVTTTLGVLALAGAATVVGSKILETRAAQTEVPEPATPAPVSVRKVSLQDSYARTRSFVGQVEPARQVDIAFELAGRMIERTVDEGDMVEKGDLIARLDIELLAAEKDRLRAARAAQEAQLAFAERQMQRAETLRKQGFSSVEREDQARAARDELQNRILETDAAIAAIDIRLEKSVLRAPFSGQVGSLSADPGSTLAAGQPLLSLIDVSAPQVRVGLPLDIDPDQLTKAEMQIGDMSYPARLLQLRPDIDAATRTRTALFALDSQSSQTFGRTATVTLPINIDARGAWVPLDALAEGEGGNWTVLVVENNRVRTAAVEVLHAEAPRAFIRGTFDDGALLIERGAHRVVPGQSVRVLGGGS